MQTTIDVIMPVFNERETVEKAIRRLDAIDPPENCVRRLILVDDASSDGTREVLVDVAADRDDVSVIQHPVNRGKGAAIRTGLSHSNADIILIHDADLEYDPRDHAIALAPILEGNADAVIGSRFIGQAHRVLYYWHYLANRALTTLSNMCTNLNLTDIECCTKVMTREVMDRIVIEENRFGVEPELVAKLARLRLAGARSVRIFEVPVRYAGRTYAEGKKIGARDAVWAIWCILRYAVGPHAQPDRGSLDSAIATGTNPGGE